MSDGANSTGGVQTRTTSSHRDFSGLAVLHRCVVHPREGTYRRRTSWSSAHRVQEMRWTEFVHSSTPSLKTSKPRSPTRFHPRDLPDRDPVRASAVTSDNPNLVPEPRRRARPCPIPLRQAVPHHERRASDTTGHPRHKVHLSARDGRGWCARAPGNASCACSAIAPSGRGGEWGRNTGPDRPVATLRACGRPEHHRAAWSSDPAGSRRAGGCGNARQDRGTENGTVRYRWLGQTHATGHDCAKKDRRGKTVRWRV